MLLVIAEALCSHMSEGRRRKWVFPTLTQHHKCRADGMKIIGLSPYWSDAAQGGGMQNSVEMKSLFVLTGPNGDSKSSIVRCIGATALLGICGFMVPAESAIIPQFDSIMLHINKSYHSLANGKSSFQVEMSEIRSIITRATSKSLVLIDDICRGTETAEGTCIAASVIETLDAINCLDIVSTHLHEIFDLPLRTNNVVFKAMAADCVVNQTTPTWKLIDGICKESLAFEIAQREGVPQELVQRAEELYVSHYVKDSLRRHESKIKQFSDPTSVVCESKMVTTNSESRHPKNEFSDILIKEVETAVIRICQSDILECWPMKGVFVSGKELPPPSTVHSSSVYVMFRPDKELFTGESDAVQGRIRAQRSKKGMKNASFLYFLVPGKSLARKLKTLLINQLPAQGFSLTNIADGKHRNFGTSYLRNRNI